MSVDLMFYTTGAKKMAIAEIVTMLAIGAVAGWLAGMVMKGGGFGLIGNIILGIVGSVVGTFIGGIAAGAGVTLPFSGLVGTLIWAIIGAIVLLAIVGFIKKLLA